MKADKNRKSSVTRGKWLRFSAVLLVLVMVMGTIPISAAKKKSNSEYSTEERLIEAIRKKTAQTITFKTDEEVSVTIPSVKNSKNKKLIIDAPNAVITNKTMFDTSGKTPAVTIKAVKYYTEAVSNNTLTLSGDNAGIIVAAKKKVKKLTVNADNADVVLKKKGQIKTLVFKKSGANAKVDAADKSSVNVTLSKKTSVSVAGVKTADVNVRSAAKGSTVKASIPVDLTVTKSTNFVLN